MVFVLFFCWKIMDQIRSDKAELSYVQYEDSFLD